MKYILLAMLPILAACECDNVITRNGHTYVWHPHKAGHYEHDTFCDKCGKEH